MNATMTTFGHPQTTVHETGHWAVLLRPKQVTLGSLVLVCKEDATAFSRISPDAFADLATATAGIERTLGSAFSPEKLNYLMLMMRDPHVHFHVLPRYAAPRTFAGRTFEDPAWPKPPDVSRTLDTGDDLQAALLEHLRAQWG